MSLKVLLLWTCWLLLQSLHSPPGRRSRAWQCAGLWARNTVTVRTATLRRPVVSGRVRRSVALWDKAGVALWWVYPGTVARTGHAHKVRRSSSCPMVGSKQATWIQVYFPHRSKLPYSRNVGYACLILDPVGTKVRPFWAQWVPSAHLHHPPCFSALNSCKELADAMRKPSRPASTANATSPSPSTGIREYVQALFFASQQANTTTLWLPKTPPTGGEWCRPPAPRSSTAESLFAGPTKATSSAVTAYLQRATTTPRPRSIQRDWHAPCSTGPGGSSTWRTSATCSGREGTIGHRQVSEGRETRMRGAGNCRNVSGWNLTLTTERNLANHCSSLCLSLSLCLSFLTCLSSFSSFFWNCLREDEPKWTLLTTRRVAILTGNTSFSSSLSLSLTITQKCRQRHAFPSSFNSCWLTTSAAYQTLLPLY